MKNICSYSIVDDEMMKLSAIMNNFVDNEEEQDIVVNMSNFVEEEFEFEEEEIDSGGILNIIGGGGGSEGSESETLEFSSNDDDDDDDEGEEDFDYSNDSLTDSLPNVYVSNGSGGVSNICDKLPNQEQQQQQMESQADTYFFEGAEKRLSVCFSSFLKNSLDSSSSSSSLDISSGPIPDLRTIGVEQWSRVLEHVRCRILSVTYENGYHPLSCSTQTFRHQDGINAYLLSESSLFVQRNAIMIKTCGNTQLLNFIPKLFNLARKMGFDTTSKGATTVRYSRKNFLAPHLQVPLYRSFERERTFIDTVLKKNGTVDRYGNGNGNGTDIDLVFGSFSRLSLSKSVIGSDCFYHYTSNVAGERQQPKNNDAVICSEFDSNCSSLNYFEQNKFEIIMERLEPSVMKVFYQQPSAEHNSKITASKVTRLSGIDTLIPGLIIDDYLFDPCGYSMNGIVEVTDNKLEENGEKNLSKTSYRYCTIHITPENDFSYVSLETNWIPSIHGGGGGGSGGYRDFVQKILRLFKPGKFMLNLIVPNSTTTTTTTNSTTTFSATNNNKKDNLDGFFNAQYNGFVRMEGERRPLMDDIINHQSSEVIYLRYETQ